MDPRSLRLGFAAAILAAVVGGAASGQAPAPAAKGDIDPEAVAALDRMGAYMRASVKTFQVRAVITRDNVRDNGLLTTSDATIDMVAQLPSHLRIDFKSDAKDRLYLFDGKTFTLYARKMGYYATVAAPGTSGELAKVLEDKYDIELPLADLFSWGTDRVNSSALTAALDAGPAVVDGITCEQYAFRQEGLDWQIWIQLGAYPLPLKQVITTTTDPSRPQYSAVYTWNLAPSFNDAAFTFDPPADAKRIVFAARPSGGK